MKILNGHNQDLLEVYINKMAKDFDSRNYGFSKLRDLISAIGLFDVDRMDNRVFVRNRKKKTG